MARKTAPVSVHPRSKALDHPGRQGRVVMERYGRRVYITPDTDGGYIVHKQDGTVLDTDIYCFKSANASAIEALGNGNNW